MKILAVGDVTSPRAAEALAQRLPEFKKQNGVDLAIVNGENAGFILGPTVEIARKMLFSGADVLSGGNHTLQNLSLHRLLEEDTRMLRPCNYPKGVPGRGYTIRRVRDRRVLVINALGRVHMEPPLDSPFTAIDRVLQKEEGRYDLSVVDFHAEATGEKLAMARYLDGRVTVLFGTHTHVPTADDGVLPRGTGYVTDLGMCGGRDGVMGIDSDVILKRYLTGLPEKFAPAEGPIVCDGVLFTVDDVSGKTLSTLRVRF